MDEMYYSISQVSKFTALPQSVLRYWESVFDELDPHKSAGGTRQFSEEDVQLILRIKNLLYDKGMTIKGVQKALKINKTHISVNSESIPENDKDWIVINLKSLLSYIRSSV